MRSVKAARPVHLVGGGTDDHRIRKGRSRPLVLAGVVVSTEYSPIAHSDGDVACHAVMNAILLALGERDIGHRFPDNDARYANADSMRLLAEVVGLSARMGYRVNNVTVMITALRPRLSPHVPEMKRRLALALGVSASQVGIGATTGEGLSEVGRGEGISASAQVSLVAAPRRRRT